MPDGEDEGLVVLGKDDCVVDHPTKLENSQKCSDKPGEIQINMSPGKRDSQIMMRGTNL